jgi:hypothetical protein
MMMMMMMMMMKMMMKVSPSSHQGNMTSTMAVHNDTTLKFNTLTI